VVRVRFCLSPFLLSASRVSLPPFRHRSPVIV
jgi:hypothetical protein